MPREWSPESHLGALQDAVGPTSGKLVRSRPMRKRCNICGKCLDKDGRCKDVTGGYFEPAEHS